MAAEPHQASRGLWERYVERAAGCTTLDLQEVLNMEPNLGQQGSLIGSLADKPWSRPMSSQVCVAVIRQCLQKTIDPRQLLRQGLPQPQLPERHRLNDKVVCVEVLAGLHLLLNCAKLWSGGTNERFGELLVVLVAQYIDQLLGWCGVQDASAVEVDWENIGADRLGPFDVRVWTRGANYMDRGQLLLAIEATSSPNLDEDQWPITRNQWQKAQQLGPKFILAGIGGCKGAGDSSMTGPIRLTLFRDPVSLVEQGVLLWHPTVEGVLCLNPAAQQRQSCQRAARGKRVRPASSSVRWRRRCSDSLGSGHWQLPLCGGVVGQPLVAAGSCQLPRGLAVVSLRAWAWANE
ncbi:hypothetical protein OEZ86_000183 [Tetradesmus obliquus]|nr:hypothetical protein OEZ86_000183 [Tetradesmus obliquus]